MVRRTVISDLAASACARAFRISPAEADPQRRGFEVSDGVKEQRLRSIGETFITGYNLSLVTPVADLPARLQTVPLADRGFAFEGAAMAMALLDTLLPRSRRLEAFITDGGSAHAYMVHVGAGWAMARLHRRVRRPLRRLDPLLGWLAVDGYGFHEGYFHWRRTVTRGGRPRHLRGYAGRAFDQGLGRSLWFVAGADVHRVAASVGRFPTARRPDLWAGVGLAAAYAGGVDSSELGELREQAGEAVSQLAQGAAFAAKARQRAGNPAPHTELACRLLCGVDAEAAAGLTDDALAAVGSHAGPAGYEEWRTRVADALARPVAS